MAHRSHDLSASLPKEEAFDEEAAGLLAWEGFGTFFCTPPVGLLTDS